MKKIIILLIGILFASCERQNITCKIYYQDGKEEEQKVFNTYTSQYDLSRLTDGGCSKHFNVCGVKKMWCYPNYD